MMRKTRRMWRRTNSSWRARRSWASERAARGWAASSLMARVQEKVAAAGFGLIGRCPPRGRLLVEVTPRPGQPCRRFSRSYA